MILPPRDFEHDHRLPASEAARLRVVVVADVVPERNGVGAYYRDLMAQLGRRVERAEMIAPEMDDGRWQLGPGWPMPGDPTQSLALPAARRIRRHLHQLQPTAVVVPTPGPFGFLGAHLAGRQGARLLVGFHTHLGHLTDLYWKAAAARLARVGQWWLDRSHHHLFDRADLVLANSSEMVDIARGLGAPHARLMGTPIPAAFLAEPTKTLDGPLRRVLFAGRLAPEKNLEAILEAAEAAPELDFEIAGEGPQRDLIEEAAARLPNLHYRGWLEREAVMEILDACDVLVLPSKIESFGTIALEAMARGRLVLVSTHCGILDWPALRPGLHAIGPEERLAEALRRLAALPLEQRQGSADRARKAAAALNEWTLDHWLGLLSGQELPADADAGERAPAMTTGGTDVSDARDASGAQSRPSEVDPAGPDRPQPRSV